MSVADPLPLCKMLLIILLTAVVSTQAQSKYNTLAFLTFSGAFTRHQVQR